VKTNGNETPPWVCGLDFLPDGRIAAVDYHNKTCFIMDAGLQRSGTALKFENVPIDVICYEEDKMAVTVEYVPNKLKSRLDKISKTFCFSFIANSFFYCFNVMTL